MSLPHLNFFSSRMFHFWIKRVSTLNHCKIFLWYRLHMMTSVWSRCFQYLFFFPFFYWSLSATFWKFSPIVLFLSKDAEDNFRLLQNSYDLLVLVNWSPRQTPKSMMVWVCRCCSETFDVALLLVHILCQGLQWFSISFPSICQQVNFYLMRLEKIFSLAAVAVFKGHIGARIISLWGCSRLRNLNT